MPSSDVFGESLAALSYARNVGTLSGILQGVKPPQMMSGKILFPPHMIPTFTGSGTNLTITVTAARYYCVPFYVPFNRTFSGVKFKNTGVGDNGKKVKIAFYPVDPSTGLPGSLAKSFGEQVLDGTAAIRTLASSWTPATGGWYWGMLVSDTGPVLAAMNCGTSVSGAGFFAASNISIQFSAFAADILSTSGINTPNYLCDYVGGTYANFPEATGLTPATSIVSDAAGIPAFGLYV